MILHNEYDYVEQQQHGPAHLDNVIGDCGLPPVLSCPLTVRPPFITTSRADIHLRPDVAQAETPRRSSKVRMCVLHH